jgi:hypothetical protein
LKGNMTILRPWWKRAAAVLAAWAAIAAGPRAARAAETFDLAAARKAAAVKVCRLTVQSETGACLGYATGFLIGDGRFALTDLAAAAQPGAAQADLLFEDGTRAKALAFGMADVALGVAALRVDGDPLPQGGLRLRPGPAAADGSLRVVTAGWQWSERLMAGPTAAQLAVQLGLPVPPGPRAFAGLYGGAVPGTTGAPILDERGEVVGVLLDLAGGPGGPLVVPAAAVRDAILSAKPELKPLAALPKPLWPTRVRVMAGEPVRPPSVGWAARDLPARVRCGRCAGRGTVSAKRVVGRGMVLGRPRPIWGLVAETCPDCQGEGVAVKNDTYQYFGNVALLGTKAWYQPESDEAARASVRESALDLLRGLAKAGPEFRRAFAQAAAEALRKGRAAHEFPAGAVLYAQVRETDDGPDGRYIVLAPYQGAPLLVTRTGAGGAAPNPGKPDPGPPWSYGDWIVVAGAVEPPVRVAGRHLAYLRVLGGVGGPFLGPAPPRPAQPGAGPDQPAPGPPGRTDGIPDFFGL